jgi:hypothetical protein
MFSLDELLDGYEAPEIGGEIGEPGEAEFTGIDFDFGEEKSEAEPPEIELDFNGDPLEFEDLEDIDDFEDIEPEDLEETETIRSNDEE